MKVHRVSPEAAVPAGEQFFVGDVRVQPIVSGTEGIDIIIVRTTIITAKALRILCWTRFAELAYGFPPVDPL